MDIQSPCRWENMLRSIFVGETDFLKTLEIAVNYNQEEETERTSGSGDMERGSEDI